MRSGCREEKRGSDAAWCPCLSGGAGGVRFMGEWMGKVKGSRLHRYVRAAYPTTARDSRRMAPKPSAMSLVGPTLAEAQCL